MTLVREVKDSSTIKNYTYDTAESVLSVEFKNGGVYRYLDVPKSIVDELDIAESKGKYHAEFIRGEFEYEKLV